jgi:hypothetical protein
MPKDESLPSRKKMRKGTHSCFECRLCLLSFFFFPFVCVLFVLRWVSDDSFFLLLLYCFHFIASSLLLLYLLYDRYSCCIDSIITTPTASALPPLILHLLYIVSTLNRLPLCTTLGHSSDSPRSSPQDPLHLPVR